MLCFIITCAWISKREEGRKGEKEDRWKGRGRRRERGEVRGERADGRWEVEDGRWEIGDGGGERMGGEERGEGTREN